MKRWRSTPRLRLLPAVLWAAWLFLSPTLLLAADPFAEALSPWKTRYDEALKKADQAAASANKDDAAELRFRLGELERKRNQLNQLASTLRDRQSEMETLSSRENFLKNDLESAQRQYEWLLKQYQEKMAQLNQEWDERNRRTDEHNARLGEKRDKAAADAYNAEAARQNNWLEQLKSRKQQLVAGEGKQVDEAKVLVSNKQKEYEEGKAKLQALKQQQEPQVRLFNSLLAEASSALTALPQGLSLGSVRRQVAELASPPPVQAAPSKSGLNFLGLEPFPQGSPANPGLVPRDPAEGNQPGMNTGAMDQLKSAAAHGKDAKNAPTREEASEQSRRPFDTAGKDAGSLDPMVVDGRGSGYKEPVVPKEKRTPALETLEKKRDTEKQEWQKQEQKVTELEKLPRTPERNVEIVKAREQADQAKNKMRFSNFMLTVALEEAPTVPGSDKGTPRKSPPPPAPSKP
ncbi:MAG: hypothetical protein V1782_04845 [Pseudomonadota bacterium]